MQQTAEERQVMAALNAAVEAGESVVLATIVSARGSVPRNAGTKMLIYPNGRLVGTIGGGAMEALVCQEAQAVCQSCQPKLLPYTLVDPGRGDPGVCGGEVQIYLEPYIPAAILLVIGGGHVGQAVCQLAKWLGFRVAITDDRPEFAQPGHIPDANVYLPYPFAEALNHFAITPQTYVVAVTRNMMLDREILPHLVNTPAAYIGLIGSQRRWTETQKLLRQDGMTQADITRIHSPIGLELEAETPAEIALSIMAEVVMHYRGGVAASSPHQPE